MILRAMMSSPRDDVLKHTHRNNRPQQIVTIDNRPLLKILRSRTEININGQSW